LVGAEEIHTAERTTKFEEEGDCNLKKERNK
jgi:hypothetical protein